MQQCDLAASPDLDGVDTHDDLRHAVTPAPRTHKLDLERLGQAAVTVRYLRFLVDRVRPTVMRSSCLSVPDPEHFVFPMRDQRPYDGRHGA